MLSKADHIFPQGSEHVHSRRKPPACVLPTAARDSGPAPLCSALLAEFQGMQAAGLRALRGFEKKGVRVAGAS